MSKFGVVTGESGALLESRSGADVHAARTADGQSVYLKLTRSTAGPDAIAAALRELRFYQELAPTAPVRTPNLLDAANLDDGVALLLEAAGEPLPAGSWTPDTWAALGRDLAALHSMPAPTGPGWHRPDALRQALTDPDLPAIEAFWAPALPRLADLLSRRTELEQLMGAPSPAFVHGDCHTGNITHAGAAPVLLDWQESGIGRPGSDLAFLNVRATPAGVTAPPELLDAYLGGQTGDRRTLELALVAEELAVYLFLWPPYAAYNSAAGVERVRQRTRALCDQWFDAQAETREH